jgi:formate dehydrogenase major subunit
VSVNPADLGALNVAAGDALKLETRRGSVTALVRRDPGMPRGSVFMPFCYVEAAANILTNPVLDPFGKIPEFKYCAVRLSRSDVTPDPAGYGAAAAAAGD